MDAVYIVSKVFTFFLAPAVWILLLIIWRRFAKLRSTKKRVTIAAVIIFLIFSNGALYKLSVNAWQPSPVMLYNIMKRALY